MAPPSTKAVLSKIDPRLLATEVTDRVRDHATRLALALGMTLRESGPCDLAATVQDLAEYAQTGDGDPRDVEAQVMDVGCCLYSGAGMPGNASGGGFMLEIAEENADIDTPIGLVIVAAFARVALAEREPISTTQLAALASLSPRQVQQLTLAGELKPDPIEPGGSVSVEPRRGNYFTAATARRWLSGRGVPGFAPKRR